MLWDTRATLVISTGPAGTGKTMGACAVGLEKLRSGDYERLVVTRPTVPVANETLGHLPGTLADKMWPWLAHMSEYIDMDKIETLPLSHMRGHTFHNTWVLADEMQNSTVTQMKTLLTRVGESSKVVVTGDLGQSDLAGTNGLEDLLRRVEAAGDLENVHVRFTTDDIKRSDFVKYIYKLYG
jgi:phosphate starvation-inducible PhoH-like protein